MRRSASIFSLCAISLLAGSSAHAGIELQSISVDRYNINYSEGEAVIYARVTYLENEEAFEPLLLDFGDGSAPVDLLTPDPDETPSSWSGLPLRFLDADRGEFVMMSRKILHQFPPGFESTTLRVVQGAHPRHDFINHDGAPLEYSVTHSLQQALLSLNLMSLERAVDPGVLMFAAGKKHSYDLVPSALRDPASRRCRLLGAEESGLFENPRIGESSLRVTEDCKVQWDTTQAQVGDRFIFAFEMKDDASGREWKSVQTIQIVEDLDAICEVTPGSAYFPGFTLSREVPGPQIPVRYIKTEDHLAQPHLEGVPRLVTGYGYGPGNGDVPVPVWDEKIVTTYTVARDFPGTYLANTRANYLEGLDRLGPTVCPIEVTIGCVDAPEQDRDGDGVCDVVDNCPDQGASADQWDGDGDGLGDLCDPDRDGDGIADDRDACPSSNLGLATNAWGCSAQDLCPCPETIWTWESKEQCTARVSLQFVFQGLMTAKERQALIDQAAETQCPAPRPPSWRDLFFWF